MQTKKIYINNLIELEDFAKEVAKKSRPQKLIFLKGNLGAGKTTFSQFFLKALGFEALVKSPTYTLIEPYEINNQKVYHLDLYRLQSDDELYHLGVADLLTESAIFLIEWPERLEGLGVKPDLEIELQLDSQNPAARYLRILS